MQHAMRLLIFSMTFAHASAAGSRLTIVNGCGNEAIWIADSVGKTSLKLNPGESRQYSTPDGLSSTRFWPKMRCDGAGQQCDIGDSGGPGQACGQGGCAPPTDSKFEATFGRQGGNCRADASQCDWWDTSAVDGFTLPYKVEISSHCKTNGYSGSDIDCSRLTLNQCPSSGSSGDLRLRSPRTGAIVGCYSPCSLLTDSNWNNPKGGHSPTDGVANPYCCPTPPVSSAQCRAGPAASSEYANLIHSHCPGVYSYAYDDAIGLQVCPPETTYKWTLFCPAGGSSPPPPPPPSPSCQDRNSNCAQYKAYGYCASSVDSMKYWCASSCGFCGGPGPSPTPAPPGKWQPCRYGACCNPNQYPRQYCPGGVECQQCGGGSACQCPGAVANASVIV